MSSAFDRVLCGGVYDIPATKMPESIIDMLGGGADMLGVICWQHSYSRLGRILKVAETKKSRIYISFSSLHVVLRRKSFVTQKHLSPTVGSC